MKRAVFSLPFLFVAFAVNAQEQPKSGPLIAGEVAYHMEYLDKTWGIKLKSIDPGKANSGTCTLLLEFSKDVDDLKQMRAAFSEIGAPHVLYYLFDQDNVVVGKSGLKDIEGELTGKKGDAFRVKIMNHAGPSKKVFKVEARPNEATRIDPPKKFVEKIEKK
ncbi:MAG TPA: hypothetical protein VFE62_20195 [Gemmataceae bacterium]|nr:hypothetical protein [Gemmataceae bacterium]